MDERHDTQQTVLTDTPAEPSNAAGKIHVLDLAALKARLGPKWARMAEHVQMFFDAAIRRSLRPGDTFCRFEELSYFVMFRGLSSSEADLKCAAISREVCLRLFGENGEQVSLRTMVGDVNLAALPADAEKTAELDALLERSGKETVISRGGANPPAPAAAETNERLLYLGMTDGSVKRSRLSSRELSFLYRPVWDATKQVIATYLCQPVLPAVKTGAKPLIGFCASDAEEDQAALDLLVLNECAERGGHLLDLGFRVLLGIPVHFATVARPRLWQAYAARHRQIAPEVARDFMFIVFGIDKGVPNIRLAQELPKLAQHAHRVFCVLDWPDGAGQHFAKTGTHGFGIVLNQSDTEQQSIARMSQLGKEARIAGVASFVMGMGSTSLTLCAISDGIRYLEGPVVRPAIGDPRHVFVQGLEDLYQPRAAGRSF